MSTIDDDEIHMIDAAQAASEKYAEKARAYRRIDGSFCGTCGLIGYQLWSAALLEAFLESDLEDDVRNHVAGQLAAIVGKPFPTHGDEATPPHRDAVLA